MKYSLTFLLTALLAFSSMADTGTLETIELDSKLVGISFEDNDKTLVMNFSDEIIGSSHSIIKINRINNLEYKTRVMRYFGGLLVNNTYKFKNLIVVIDGKRLKYDWSRDNVSTVVKKMCLQAELMV